MLRNGLCTPEVILRTVN
jgi:hypothetical protein